MKKILCVCILAFSMCLSSFASGKAEEDCCVTLTGYLIDKHCLDKKNPADETVMCLKMEACEKDGYGIAVEQSDGTFRYFRFDTEGRKKAHEIVFSSTKEQIGKITVTGKIDGDSFDVNTIVEKK